MELDLGDPRAGGEAQCEERAGEKWGQWALVWEMGSLLGLSVRGRTEQVLGACRIHRAGWSRVCPPQEARRGCSGGGNRGTGQCWAWYYDGS